MSMRSRARTSTRALSFALCLTAAFCDTTTPGVGDPPLTDDPQWDLPWCTDDQLKLREGSRECFFRFLSVTEGVGVCPPECCCDHTPGDNNVTRMISTPGSCTVQFVVNKENNPVILWMEPFSVLATGSHQNCSKTTTDLCGDLGEGCRFLPTPRSSVSPSPKPEEQNSDAGDSDDGSRTRNIALACVAVLLLLVLVGITVAYFIIVPWLRGNLDDSANDDSDSTEIDDGSPTYTTHPTPAVIE